ncbi:neutral zinc metallopeptidase, partial [Salmonella enterica subsp. enterica serovar Anatum]|nr:neutral zinc metallopeptidase [Salmonella enterica subsp. enterica serovar Anatum]
LGADGDFAQGYVIAHEVGHHVQKLLDIEPKVRQLQQNASQTEAGTFHGGDLRGLTSQLDYLQQLGVNALWISSPFEQIHGWVGGG